MNSHSMKLEQKGSLLFWAAFWLTILALLAVYVYARLEQSRIVVDAQGKVSLTEEFIQTYEENLPEILGRQNQHMIEAGTNINAIINERVDLAFKPVYEQIPKVADFHYSVVGEYTELMAALTGDLTGTLNRMLFQETGFTDRLNQNIGTIEKQAKPLITEALQKMNTDLQKQLGLSDKELGAMAKIATLSIEDAESRFSASYNAIRASGATVGASAVGAMVAKTLGKKLAGKIGGKMAGKTALKATGIGSGATSGAVVGASLGPAGAIVGGLVGGLVAWVATDKVIVEIDEYFNRDEFSQEITNSLDQEKQRLKKQLSALYQGYINEILKHNKRNLEGLKTRDLIEGQ